MELQATPETREAMIDKALAQYDIAEAGIAEMKAKSAGLKISGLDDKEGFEIVKAARMGYVRARSAVEKKRKELKADALEFGRRVDGRAKQLTDLLLEGETPLEAQENAVVAEKARIQREAQDRAEAARKAKLDARMAQAAAIRWVVAPSAVEAMSDEDFAATLLHNTAAFAAEKVAAAKAEAERKAAEVEEALQRSQVEAAEREARRIDSERVAQERAAAEAQRQVNSEAQRKLDADRAEVERQRREIEAEKAKAAQAAAAKQAAKEAKEAEKAEAARLAELAPDVEKIEVYLEAIAAVPMPSVWCADEINAVIAEAVEKISALFPEAKKQRKAQGDH